MLNGIILRLLLFATLSFGQLIAANIEDFSLDIQALKSDTLNTFRPSPTREQESLIQQVGSYLGRRNTPISLVVKVLGPPTESKLVMNQNQEEVSFLPGLQIPTLADYEMKSDSILHSDRKLIIKYCWRVDFDCLVLLTDPATQLVHEIKWEVQS